MFKMHLLNHQNVIIDRKQADNSGDSTIGTSSFLSMLKQSLADRVRFPEKTGAESRKKHDIKFITTTAYDTKNNIQYIVSRTIFT